MPKANATKSLSKIIYPHCVKELTEDLSTDDLVRRLKDCAQAFQNMSQDDDNSPYVPLALYLASDFFLEHPSKDVRLIIACSIADVFRVFAPEAPYKDPDHLKIIFEFFIQQLKGLEDPKDPIFKRYFYLLENLAWVKSFNICIELEDNQSIFCQLFTLIFNIVNDNHSTKVKNFMMDMMCPLISEADSVSQELMDIILAQIIEPRKTQNKNAYNLAKDILRRTSATIEPYLQAFFNNALILGKTSRSDVAHHLYDLIYELNSVCPSMLVAVLPQLEFKLKSNEEKERLEVSRLLARMFSDKNSDLASQNKPLWNCFLGRFNDISVQVRIRCVQYSMHFLLNHPELTEDIKEQLRHRQHDPEEAVRYEVVMAIISAAKKDFSSISEELLNFVKERTLDKKFKIRKEALLGLAMLYKQHMNSSDLPAATLDCISWIKNKVLHGYYQSALEDRLLVERILYTCLVPYQNEFEDRMKKLYQLFATVDDNAVKAFNELLKCQNIVRNQLCGIMEIIEQKNIEDRSKIINNRIINISKNLPEPIKSQEYLRKFCISLENNQKLRSHLNVILKGISSCSEVEFSVKEILKSLGFPVQMNSFYMTIKQLLERVAPVMIDHSGIKQLLLYIKDSLFDGGNIDKQLGIENSAHRGLQLLYTLSFVFPGSFHGEVIFNELLNFFCADDERAAELTLQILTNICDDIEKKHPNIAQRLLPVLKNFVENGSVKQAKYAVACINRAVSNKEIIFGQIIEHLKQHLSLSSGYFRTALVSVGHIAYHCPEMFVPHIKSIVSKVIVKELLMMDQEFSREKEGSWETYEELPEETKVKVEGMKVMVRWLLGLKTAVPSATSTLRLLTSVIMHHGDLMEKGLISSVEKSWLRLTAASCILKLCQEPSYAEAMTLEQFQILSSVICDECYEVREKFAFKLHKGLMALKLPLDFLAVFALCGMENTRELKSVFKQYLIANITKRREYLKQHLITTWKLFTILPDYVLPYAIHLLAHESSLKNYDDIASLNQIKDCLWFLMEPLMTKNENYSFSFFKRLIENIKQTRDKQAPDDPLVNLKLYAVCDLALGLVISKTTNFVLKDFPVEPSLPSKLFTNPDKSYSNIKTYLPQELAFTPPKKSGIEMEMFGLTAKGTNRRASINQNSKREIPSNTDLNNSDQKENSKLTLNIEEQKIKKKFQGSDNPCKTHKETFSPKESSKNLDDDILSDNKPIKRSPGRPKKILNNKQIEQSSSSRKLPYKKVASSSDSSNSSPIIKKPRGRPPGKKKLIFSSSAEEKNLKESLSEEKNSSNNDDQIFNNKDEQNVLNNNTKNILNNKNTLNNENKNNEKEIKNHNNTSPLFKLPSPLKRRRGRPKKTPIKNSEELYELLESASNVPNDLSESLTTKLGKSQRKRKLKNTDSSVKLISLNKQSSLTLNSTTNNITTTNNSCKNNSKSQTDSVANFTSNSKKLSSVDKCNIFINESETESSNSCVESVHIENKQIATLHTRARSIKRGAVDFQESDTDSKQSGISSVSSPEINFYSQNKHPPRSARKSFVDRSPVKRTLHSFGTKNPFENNFSLYEGKTLSPTIVTVCASPQKDVSVSLSKTPVKDQKSSYLSHKNSKESYSSSNIKICSNVVRSPSQRIQKSNNYFVSSSKNVCVNKSKRKLLSSNSVQKENSFVKTHQTVCHLSKTSRKISSISRTRSAKRLESVSSNPKSNSHNIFPVRQSERLSAAAKASRKTKMRKAHDDDMISLSKSSRSPLLSPNRQAGSSKQSKKVRTTLSTEKMSGNKDSAINSPNKKNTSSTLLAKTIKSASLTPRSIKSNIQRNLKQKR